MYAWETHLTTRDTNRIVRPLEWGIEWTRLWPQVNGSFPASPSEYDNAGKLRPAQFLRFTSPVRTPYPQNDVVNARWFPAFDREGRPSKKAVIVLPQWNADAFSHNALCAIMNRYGVSALRLSKPYHDIRRPAEIERSDYAVSANSGRTLDSCRQGVIDIRCCLDWLESQGCWRFGTQHRSFAMRRWETWPKY